MFRGKYLYAAIIACCSIGVSFSSPMKMFKYKNAESHSKVPKTEKALTTPVYGEETPTDKMKYEEAVEDRPQRKDEQSVDGSSGLSQFETVTSTPEGSTLIEYYYLHTMTI